MPNMMRKMTTNQKREKNDAKTPVKKALESKLRAVKFKTPRIAVEIQNQLCFLTLPCSKKPLFSASFLTAFLKDCQKLPNPEIFICFLRSSKVTTCSSRFIPKPTSCSSVKWECKSPSSLKYIFSNVLRFGLLLRFSLSILKTIAYSYLDCVKNKIFTKYLLVATERYFFFAKSKSVAMKDWVPILLFWFKRISTSAGGSLDGGS